eukprot:365203-Chlamydomonas_euryale.AAC.22
MEVEDRDAQHGRLCAAPCAPFPPCDVPTAGDLGDARNDAFLDLRDDLPSCKNKLLLAILLCARGTSSSCYVMGTRLAT